MNNKSPINTFHVIGKTALKRWPCENQRTAWRIFCKSINELQKEHQLKTRAFVLMGNHYHWLCQNNDVENPPVFKLLHERINFHFHYEADSRNHVFGPTPQVVVISSKASYTNTYKYIYQNPLTAGLAFKAEDYPYSTLGTVLGRAKTSFQIEDNMNLITDPHRVVHWINAPWGEQLYLKYYSEGPQPLADYFVNLKLDIISNYDTIV